MCLRCVAAAFGLFHDESMRFLTQVDGIGNVPSIHAEVVLLSLFVIFHLWFSWLMMSNVDDS